MQKRGDKMCVGNIGVQEARNVRIKVVMLNRLMIGKSGYMTGIRRIA